MQDFDFTNFPAGTVVADLGSGSGEQLFQLKQRGCSGVGIEPDAGRVRGCGSMGLVVLRGVAEHIPLRDESCDGVICKVVIPYTDESLVVREIGRVLKTGARANISYHGAGYYLRYLIGAVSWKHRIYAARTLVNTWLYSASGRRLPSFLGDTLYQSNARLKKYYDQHKLELISERSSPSLAKFPVFIYHSIQKW